jgi:hypothetical protein
LIITVKSAEKGKIKLQIRRKTGFEYKEIEIEKMHNYITAMEFVADSHQEDFIFLIDDKMKSFVAERLENLAIEHNKK